MSEERNSPVGEDGDDDGILDDLLGLQPDDSETETEEQSEPGPEPGEQELPPAQPTRGQRRAQALRNRLKDQEDENRRLRADIERILAQTRQPAAPPPDPYRQAELARQEQERLAMMAPHEVAAYTEQKLRAEWSQQRLQDQARLEDLVDRQTFENTKARSPIAARYADQVETALAQLRLQGQNYPREVILRQLIGNAMLTEEPRRTEAARRRGARQIAAQTTQPGVGRSAAPTDRRRTRDDGDAALDERLRNVTIGDA